MTTMLTELYDALKEAGASEDKARRAAESLADYEKKFAAMGAELGTVKWMIGANITLTLLILGKLFIVS